MTKTVVIDARGHMLGRLASILAKQLLNGKQIVVVRTEDLCISGGIVRQKMKYERFLNKRMNTQPNHGPHHFRAPSKILWRTVRGMVPHKTKRGAAALERMRTFEGVPPPYDKVKRMVVPEALKVLRLQHGHKYCKLGDLSAAVGWKHQEAVKELEEVRKVRSHEYFDAKRKLKALKAKATTTVEGQKA
jgi:large subunit ribosomal protein L13Ae